MRQALILIALFSVSAGPAFAVQDRYGPPRAEPVHTAQTPAVPTGPMLRWTGKSAASQDAVAAVAPEPLRPAPLTPWAERLSGTPAAAPVAAAPAVQRVAIAPPPMQPVSQPARMAPPPAYAERPVVAPAMAPKAPDYTPRVAPTPVATAQAPGAAARPRFYSVARQYGADPDPIPAPTAARGEALTLGEVPVSEPLGRTYAPLDDARANQAVAIPDTKQNAASNRISRLGL